VSARTGTGLTRAPGMWSLLHQPPVRWFPVRANQQS
jgi:hypothetical protein